MLAEMIDKIVSLKETKIFEIDGQTYSDANLTRIPPHVDRPDSVSVSGLDAVCKLVRPRIKLQPFRTFLEVAQPESEFLLRVDSEKGIAFFEADGGIWRLEAKRNIAEYFERGLKDLIEQGKVVIMQ